MYFRILFVTLRTFSILWGTFGYFMYCRVLEDTLGYFRVLKSILDNFRPFEDTLWYFREL